MSHLEDTLRLLAKRLYAAERPVLWASGGKDSTALLSLCRPWAGKLTVIHATNEDGWPGTTDILCQHCTEWGYMPRLMLVKPWLTLEAYVQQYGWPVDIVPTALEGGTALADSCYRTSPIKLASWLHCSYLRGICPLLVATAEHRADLLMTGSRLSDGPGNTMFAQDVLPPSPVGWERINPLAAWTTAELWAYIDAHQIALPDIYRLKRHATYEFVDCMSCTWQPEHWQMMREHFPEEYARRWPQVKPVYEALSQALEKGASACHALLHPTS